MTALAQQLRRSLPRDDGAWRRINCYRARICLGELTWGSDETLDWSINLATSMIDYEPDPR